MRAHILVIAKKRKLSEAIRALHKLRIKNYSVPATGKYDIVIPTGSKISDIDALAQKLFKIPGIIKIFLKIDPLPIYLRKR